jgi:hypothetical protein
MAIFDRDDLSGNDMRPERGYPSDVGSKAPAWIAGIVIVAAIIGVFAYESSNSGAHRAPAQTHDVAPAPAPSVIPAPPAAPESPAKP